MLKIIELKQTGACFASVTSDDDRGRVFGPIMASVDEARSFAAWLMAGGICVETDLTERGLAFRLQYFREEVACAGAAPPHASMMRDVAESRRSVRGALVREAGVGR